jgi:hypothetical protein
VRRVWLFVLAGVVLLSGCNGPPPSRLKFNNRLARNVRELGKLGVKFRTATDQGLNADPNFKMTTLEGLAQEMDRLVKQHTSDAEYLSLPRLSQGAAGTLLSKYKDFLKSQGIIATTHVPKIIEVLKSGKSKAQKDTEVEALYKKIELEESKARRDLESAQREWASECNFTLSPR